jgi:hypothetical protein
MRIYEGSPRQDFEEVFRSIGAFLDNKGLRDILVLEVPDGFIVQGMVASDAGSAGWSDSLGTVSKQTLSFLDEDIARFMEEAGARRGREAVEGIHAGPHESALRVIGRWIDEEKPRDVFLFEQGGAYVVRLQIGGQGGTHHHELAEFTREDIDGLVAQGPSLRGKPASGDESAGDATSQPSEAAAPADPTG